MKIEVVKGVIRQDGKEFAQGSVIEMEDSEAQSVITMGIAREAVAAEADNKEKAATKTGGAK